MTVALPHSTKRGVLLLGFLVIAVRTSATPAVPCAGDCNGDGEVTVDEVITGVNIALGLVAIEVCLAFDSDAAGGVTVDEVVNAITNALDGCSRPLPTASPSATPAHTASRSPTLIPVATSTVTSTATQAPTSTGTPSPSATPTATTPPDIPTPEPVPTIGSALRVWLQEGNYLNWAAESAPHPSAGPHFGIVRTFFNPTVFASFQAGLPSHPQGSALVKELYGSGETVLGWSVMVKVQNDSAGGEGWYWYERFGNSTFANGLGEAGCAGCHSLGQDFVRAPFPLQ
jgi:hypothetical protein